MAYTAMITEVRRLSNGLEVRVDFTDSGSQPGFQRDYSFSGSETRADVVAHVRAELARVNKIQPLEIRLNQDVAARIVITET